VRGAATLSTLWLSPVRNKCANLITPVWSTQASMVKNNEESKYRVKTGFVRVMEILESDGIL